MTATPSKTSLSPGEAYTVQVAVGLTASGQAGYWISGNNASTPAVSLSGGPGTAPFSAGMTAPASAGTYTYKVWAAKGKPGSGGMALSTTYQITVGSAPPAGDAQAPTTTAKGATNNGWYKGAVTVDLSAADNAGGTGVDFITYTLDSGTPVKVAGATAQVAVSGDGRHTIQYAATDLSANTETTRTLTLNIDGAKPVAAVLANAKVKKGAKATLKYKITDTPRTGTAADHRQDQEQDRQGREDPEERGAARGQGTEHQVHLQAAEGHLQGLGHGQGQGGQRLRRQRGAGS